MGDDKLPNEVPASPERKRAAAAGGKNFRVDLLQVERHVVERVEAILQPIGEARQTDMFPAFALVAAASLVACPLLFLIFWLVFGLSWWAAFLWAVLILLGAWGAMVVLSCLRDPSRAADLAACEFADSFPASAPASAMAVNVISAKMQIMVEDAYEAIRRSADPATIRTPMPEYNASEYLLWKTLAEKGVIDADTAASTTAVFEEGCRR